MAQANPYPWVAEFELAVLRQLIADPVLLPRVAAHLKPERFRTVEAQVIVERMVLFHDKHGKAPTRIVVLQMIREQVEAGKIKFDMLTGCALLLEAGEEQIPADSDYVRGAILGEARKQAVWDALDAGLKDYKTGEFERIAEQLQTAAQIGKVDASPGIDLVTSLEERTQERREGKTPPRWGTGIGDLDDVIRGGLAAGEVGVILAPPKYGKSLFLGQVAITSMALGGTVTYYTLEMSEREVADRMDAAIARVPMRLLSEKADYVQTTVSDWLAERRAALVIKQFPSYDTTVRDIDAHLQQGRAERSIVPSVVIVDSGDLCTASRARDSMYEDLGAVYSELKGLASRWSVPLWTASWAKRDAVAKKIVTMADVADSFRKVAIADVGIAICATEEERQDGLARLYVAFCRYATSGVIVGPFKTAFAEGRFAQEGAIEEDLPI
jgi:replicative DNA helicase